MSLSGLLVQKITKLHAVLVDGDGYATYEEAAGGQRLLEEIIRVAQEFDEQVPSERPKGQVVLRGTLTGVLRVERPHG